MRRCIMLRMHTNVVPSSSHSREPAPSLRLISYLFKRAILCVAACLACAVCSAAEPLPRSVLILDPFAGNLPWVGARNAAFRATLNSGRAWPISIYEEYLDLNRFSGPKYRQSVQDHFREKYRDKPIGMIVAFGPSALDYAIQLRAELWPDRSIVFGEVAEAAISRSSLPPGLTGTTVHFTLTEMAMVARMLMPHLKRIALVGDPLDHLPAFRHFKEEIPAITASLLYTDLTGLTMGDLRRRVMDLPEDTAILYTAINFDGAGESYIPAEALSLVAEVANRPIIVNTETSIGRGAVGGFVLTPGSVGEEAARLASRILEGEDASKINVTTNIVNTPVFDWRELKRWNINEGRLPPGSEVRFRPQSMWEQYHWQMVAIAAILLLQAVMIANLLVERHRRLAAESASRGHLLEVLHLNRIATAGVLSASFAHELNQPLATILSNTEAAELNLESATPDIGLVKAILADIRRDDQRAGEIIKHLQGLLRKKREPELEEFDVNDAVRDALNFLEPEAKRRRITLSAVHGPGAFYVRADPVHLQQVLLNLVANGIDAMVNEAPGKRTMVLQTELINGSEVAVSIADNGVGIPDGKLNDIFKPFFTTKPQGTGIGLTISRAIMQIYGGKIWAENRPGGGAVFRISMPLAKVLSE
jgi:signal transduction histidine kinase